MTTLFSYWPEGLDAITADKFKPEEEVITELLEKIDLSDAQYADIYREAEDMVEMSRKRKKDRSMLDAFMSEYGLGNEEGIALMCLAEALLRVPDAETRDALIGDKLSPHDWSKHLGKADTVWVNASTWGLLLTGRVTGLSEEFRVTPSNVISKLTNRLGEPVIRNAVMNAMRMMGQEFVQGQTIKRAIKNGRKRFGDTQGYSFDMLGEAARTQEDAKRYLEAYKNALEVIGADVAKGKARQGISVKLSALSPHYHVSHWDSAVPEIGDLVVDLARRAVELGVDLTLDAEEADRLEISLAIFDYVARKLDSGGRARFGLAIQAFGRRAPKVIDFIASLGRELEKRFHIRLVKGAYWDTEIKLAQAGNHPDFPVFTRKPNTDVAYLACAQQIMENRDVFFGQFATHNAHTIAAVMAMAGDNADKFEFQRLFGMGDIVYSSAKEHYENMPPVRIYAPVGGHKDLLAYLVRRLLENGANSSFVNKYLDPDVPISEVVRDPVARVKEFDSIAHTSILRPNDIFLPERENSSGLDLSWKPHLEKVQEALDKELPKAPKDATEKDIDKAFEKADKAYFDWQALPVKDRADMLVVTADLLEKHKTELMNILIKEAGKSWSDANDEVREAVDFCRYYAAQARKMMSEPIDLPGPVGETNQLSYGSRGTFVCISPWNFSLAIFTGQIAAALVVGNCVLAKPAEQTPRIAQRTTELFYEAGIPKEVLSLIVGDGKIGGFLTSHDGVDGVAFTGGTMTAGKINKTLAEKEGAIIPLIAETGGQNCMIVDGTALPEQVTDDVISSAFLSAGQRCSATRVLYVQADIADRVIKMIKGAMDDLVVGDTHSLSTDVGPVIDENAQNALNDHIEKMKASGRPWHASPYPKTPTEGTFVVPHMFEIDSIDDLEKEHFGPILHVVRFKAKEVSKTLEEVFSTGYGLTFGIHTRIENRWKMLAKRALVGNVYVNRNMVGAIVGSQPFGGQGLSGTGFKAGGPNYLLRFMTEKSLSVNTTASGGNAALLNLESI